MNPPPGERNVDSPNDKFGLYRREPARDVVLLLSIFGALFLCWWLARPFLASIVWALALSVVAHPAQLRLERRLGPGPSALLTTILITVILIAPGIALLQKVADEAGGFFGSLNGKLSLPAIHEHAARHWFTRSLLEWAESNLNLGQELRRAAGALARQAPRVLIGSAQFVAQFVLMLVMLFFFLRDRKRFLEFLGGLLPLSGEERSLFLRRVSETIHATLFGNLIVKSVQGALGGLMFWILGLPAPALFGAIMALLAMLPIVGTSLVWGPAALYLLVTGAWVKAIVLAIWGALVVSLIDNALYPLLVASELRLHTLTILIAVLGGIIAFGVAGVVLGPAIIASTLALLEIWRARSPARPEGA